MVTKWMSIMGWQDVRKGAGSYRHPFFVYSPHLPWVGLASQR